MSTSTEAFSFNSQQLRLPTQQPQQLFGQFPLPQTPNTPLSPQQVNFNIIQALLLRQIYANSAALNKNGADGTSPVSTTSPVVLNEVVDVKPSRPKRGQYRRYDKSALEQAVQAVRSGEMSVHRAGSFFGVPHSTLEYKVKERAKKSSQSSFDDNKSPSFSNFSPSFKMPEARLKLPEGRFKMPEGYLKSPEGVVKVPEANLNMMSDIQLQEIHNNFRRILLTFAANQVRTMEESKEQ
ncbi:unnamed protein product [Bursaphelenchus okinawaensis]|uniref:HTH psq-type domain-containing protein n=1 Tax=Bursaphelenchus okinawaensis TaxID=465554 RepID=A0A811KN56_9BILA|nr:unnamed protein product [Bursaphelenchus okinawaensis]CAG9108135.1 unnamed protein product [Bursaphelenchus okinawaensis]